MLYKGNRCNDELARQVERGGGYQFLDCPPILFSPNETIAKPPQDGDAENQESHSKSPMRKRRVKPMRSSLHAGQSDEEEDEEEDRLHYGKSKLWEVLANISESQIKKLSHYKQNMARNDIKH